MACRLSADGIYWSATDTLDSKRNIFPQHNPGNGNYTVWCFFQSSTPLGWSAYTSDNNKILRVVDPGGQTGGNSGGSVPFSSFFTSFNANFNLLVSSLSTQSYSLQASDLPTHTHSFTGNTISSAPATNPKGEYTTGNMTRSAGYARNTGTQSGATGSSANHSHPISVSSTFSVPFDFSVQYIDVKFCTFNG
jgi:hypothetical protein